MFERNIHATFTTFANLTKYKDQKELPFIRQISADFQKYVHDVGQCFYPYLSQKTVPTDYKCSAFKVYDRFLNTAIKIYFDFEQSSFEQFYRRYEGMKITSNF